MIRIPKKLLLQGIFCVLVLCFLRDRLLKSGLTVRKRGVNETLLDPGPDCILHKSDTNHRANVARIQRGIESWNRSVELHNFSYIINPSTWCDRRKGEWEDLTLVIFVNSAPDHFLNRNIIRNTFGRRESWPFYAQHNQTMRAVFTLGAVDDEVLQARIRDESIMFGDIVQENFTDDYLNMTRKTIMGFKWTTTYCSRASHVMKVDDDVVVNPNAVSDAIRKGPRRYFTLGDVHHHDIVRDPQSKWGKFYTPLHLWPTRKFPPFFTGPAYIFSMDIAMKVYASTQVTPLFPWSDAYIGMCCLRAGVLLKHQRRFISTDFTKDPEETLPMDERHLRFYQGVYTAFHISTLQMKQLWEIWTNRTISL